MQIDEININYNTIAYSIDINFTNSYFIEEKTIRHRSSND